MNTKFQQIGRTDDSLNNNDWFYFSFGDNDANRYKMQQTLIQGSFEGCIVELYWYYTTAWYLDRRVWTVDYTIDSTTGAQKVMFYKAKEKSLLKNTDTYIPCLKEELYYHPFGRFFFYYWKNTYIYVVDRGFTTETGNACTITQDPTAVNIWSVALTNSQKINKPTYYLSYVYISWWHNSNGYSYIQRWDTTMNTAGSSFTSSFSTILTSVANRYFTDVYGMRDVGIFYTYSGQVGYYLQKITSSDGTASGASLTKDSTYTWKIFQANPNGYDDYRPVFVSSSNEPNKYYKATNVLNLDFTDSASKYNFFTYPVVFGKYYAMEMRPGT